MDLGNFLGSLGGSVGSQVPGFAGGMIPTQAAPMPQPPLQARAPLPQKKPFAENALGMIMGVVGDALLARGGLNPIYAPTMMKQRQRRSQGQALANYLGQLDPKMTEMLTSGEIEPSDALSLYKIVHPPAEKSSMQRDYEYYNTLDGPAKAGFEKMIQLTHPGMLSPIQMGPNDTLEMPGQEAPSGDVTATGPDGTKIRLNPQTNQWEPIGGQTGQPSGGFLDDVTARSESGNRDFGADGKLIRSSAGALGRMQVMPATASKPGFGVRPASSQNPSELARVGREYRAAMHRKYGGDLAKMWAAYNAGPGRVDAAIQQHGDRWLDGLPDETRAYVAQNLRAVRS